MPPTPPHHDEPVSVLRLIVGVAVLVALVILVFFAVGYGLGRVFL